MPIAPISPASSAIGMNAIGGIGPRSGWSQRTSASAPTGRPVSSCTIGWYATCSWPSARAVRSAASSSIRSRTRSCIEVSKIVDRPGPSALDRYIAVSASRISASAVTAGSSSPAACAMPIDALITTSVSRTGSGRAKQPRISSTSRSAPGLLARRTRAGTRRRRPGPPWSPAGHRRAQPPGHLDDQLVAGVVAPRLVDPLEAVQVEQVHPDPLRSGRRHRGEQPLDLRRDHPPVRQAGQRVVHRLVLGVQLRGDLGLHRGHRAHQQQRDHHRAADADGQPVAGRAAADRHEQHERGRRRPARAAPSGARTRPAPGGGRPGSARPPTGAARSPRTA